MASTQPHEGQSNSIGLSNAPSVPRRESGVSGAEDADGGDDTEPLLPEQAEKLERMKHKRHIVKVKAQLRVYEEEENKLAEEYRRQNKVRDERGLNHLRQSEAARNHSGHDHSRQAGHVTIDLEAPYFKLVNNLLFIENSPIHKKALEDWKGKEKLFKLRVNQKSLEVSSLKNEIYQLLGFFSVFQGVVLTAVAQSNLLHCNNWWSPVTLSVLASFVTVAAIFQKLLQISSLQGTIRTETANLKDVVKLENALRNQGPNFVFAQFDDIKSVEPKLDLVFLVYSGIVIGFLIVFSVVFPFSYWRILCHSGSTPGPSPASK